VAITDKAWADTAAPLRIRAAAEAALALLSPRRDAQPVKDLARTLDDLRLGNVPAPAALERQAHLARTINVLIELLAADLAHRPALAEEVSRLRRRYVKVRENARSMDQRLQAAAETLTDLAAAAETAENPRPDLLGRLLLLDATMVAGGPRDAGLRPVAHELARAAQLIVCRLRRRDPAPAAPELLDDALRRLDLVARESTDNARLASVLEALVESFAARQSEDKRIGNRR